jgi:phosphate transport system substrate-binding protein
MKLLKKLLISTVFLFGSISYINAVAADMTGAGSSFIFPVLSKWAEAYQAKTGNKLNYQSIGSGGGMKAIKAKTVDFGATDSPMLSADLDAGGMVQFPAIIGGVVPVVNIEGVKAGELKLNGELLAKIFSGAILSWNDKRIVAINPGVKLPATTITVVTRADSSGTTAIFTDYLGKLSPFFKDTVGQGTTVSWPASSTLSGKGNEGVAANVARIKDSIGYVEFAFAKKNNLTYIQLQNAAGKFVMPQEKSFAAAAAGVEWSKFPGMATFITNAPGDASWPITGATFIVVYKNPSDKAKADEVLKFFDYAFKEGKDMALSLEYVPMPNDTVGYINSSVWSQVTRK